MADAMQALKVEMVEVCRQTVACCSALQQYFKDCIDKTRVSDDYVQHVTDAKVGISKIIVLLERNITKKTEVSGMVISLGDFLKDVVICLGEDAVKKAEVFLKFAALASLLPDRPGVEVELKTLADITSDQLTETFKALAEFSANQPNDL